MGLVALVAIAAFTEAQRVRPASASLEVVPGVMAAGEAALTGGVLGAAILGVGIGTFIDQIATDPVNNYKIGDWLYDKMFYASDHTPAPESLNTIGRKTKCGM